MTTKAFEHWIDRAFWALLCGVAVYIGGQMKELSESVNQMNTKLTVYITRSDNQTQIQSDHEARLRALEALVRK